MIKKILKNFYVYFFISFIFIFLGLSIITKDKAFSDYENRNLQLFPKVSTEKIIDGSFQKDFEEYISDQFVFKNYFVRIKNYYEILQQKYAVNDVYIGKNDFYIERHSIKNIDMSLINKNIEYVDTFKKAYNAEVYLIPNANSILDKKLLASNDFDYNSILNDLNSIDVENILKSYDGELADLYYKTDHHWTTIGAYQLYKEIIDNPIDLDLEVISDSFLGTINNKLNISMEEDTIYKQKSDTNFKVMYDLNHKTNSLYNNKYLKIKDKYSYFLDSNHGLINIENLDIDNNEKVLVIKDSYANCFVPFLAESIKYVDVIDFRYFNMKMSTYLKNNNYDRIIILYNQSGFGDNTNLKKLIL